MAEDSRSVSIIKRTMSWGEEYRIQKTGRENIRASFVEGPTRERVILEEKNASHFHVEEL